MMGDPQAAPFRLETPYKTNGLTKPCLAKSRADTELRDSYTHPGVMVLEIGMIGPGIPTESNEYLYW